MNSGHVRGRAAARLFFVLFASVCLAVVLAGFSPTFFVPVARGMFKAPLPVSVHACFFTAWISLFVVQAVLALSGKTGWHRQLGWISILLIPGMTASAVAVSLWATARDLRAGQGDAALAFLFGLFVDVLLFAALASAAVVMRRKPQAHKRLIALATIGILGPALGRIPMIGARTLLVIVVALVLSVAAYDLLNQSRIHKATLWGGLGLLASGLAQVPIGATTLWLSVARRIMSLAPY